MRTGEIIQNPLLAIKILNKGGVGVLLTDTIYGLVARAFDKKAVNYVRQLKDRDESKSFIILISSIKDIEDFGIKTNRETYQSLSKLWPGKVSVVMGCNNKKFAYIHGNINTLAFRLPQDKKMLRVLKGTGPLIAPSANPEGLEPATGIRMAKKYFGNSVDFYLKDRVKRGRPSKIVGLSRDGKIEIIRK